MTSTSSPLSLASLLHFLQSLNQELGLVALYRAPRDVHILILLRCLRTFAFGTIGLIFGLYFHALGITDGRIGLFITLTQLGDVVLSLLLTLLADIIGRRTTLFIGGSLMVVAGAVFATSDRYWILLLAAVLGVISPTGNEVGPFRAVEESTLAHLVEEEDRAEVFSWYVITATASSAAGLAAGGWAVDGLRRHQGWSKVEADQAMFWIYTVCGSLMALLSLLLTNKCEAQTSRRVVPSKQPSSTQSPAHPELPDEHAPLLQPSVEESNTAPSAPRPPNVYLSKATLTLLAIILPLFTIDSISSSLLPWSLLNYYLARKFNLAPSYLGTLMSLAYLAGMCGTFLSSPLSRRFGLIPTMVFPHLAAAIFLALIPFWDSLAWTMVFVFLRASLNAVDQAPRSAWLSQIVPPEERTKVMGIVNVVKTLAQSVGPTATGILAEDGRWWVAFVVAGSLKALYDLGLVTFYWRRDDTERPKKLSDTFEDPIGPTHLEEPLSSNSESVIRPDQ